MKAKKSPSMNLRLIGVTVGVALVLVVANRNFTFYSFGVPLDAEIENFEFHPNEWGNAGGSTYSTLLLPDSTMEIGIHHLEQSSWLQDLSTDINVPIGKNSLLTSFEIWKDESISSLRDIRVTLLLEGDVWEPDLEVLSQYSIEKEVVEFKVLEESFVFNETLAMPPYIYDYYLVYSFEPKEFPIPQALWFEEAEQRIEIDYLDSSGTLKTVEYTLPLEWEMRGTTFDKIMWTT